jgi:hypothetical protein
MKKDLWMNVFMSKIEIRNGDLRSILEENFYVLMKKFWDLEVNKVKKELGETNPMEWARKYVKEQ